MKKLLIAFLSFALLSAHAQTADEIIQKYSAAIGGLDAFNKTTSAKMTGTVTIQGNDLSLTTQILNGKGMRTEVEFNGQLVVNAYGNGKGWKINPFGGSGSPTEVSGSELVSFKAQASLANNLMDYKNRGHKVELVGQEDAGGVKAYKIKLTNKEDGKEVLYFVNATDYLIIKTVGKREIQGQEMEVETSYSKYKDIGGLKIPMAISQQADGNVFQEINWSNIELNVTIDEKIFQM